MSLPENKTTVNLEVPFFSVIMLLHKGLIHIHSHNKVAFWREFHFNWHVLSALVFVKQLSTGSIYMVFIICTTKQRQYHPKQFHQESQA